MSGCWLLVMYGRQCVMAAMKIMMVMMIILCQIYIHTYLSNLFDCSITTKQVFSYLPCLLEVVIMVIMVIISHIYIYFRNHFDLSVTICDHHGEGDYVSAH